MWIELDNAEAMETFLEAPKSAESPSEVTGPFEVKPFREVQKVGEPRGLSERLSGAGVDTLDPFPQSPGVRLFEAAESTFEMRVLDRYGLTETLELEISPSLKTWGFCEWAETLGKSDRFSVKKRPPENSETVTSMGEFRCPEGLRKDTPDAELEPLEFKDTFAAEKAHIIWD